MFHSTQGQAQAQAHQSSQGFRPPPPPSQQQRQQQQQYREEDYNNGEYYDDDEGALSTTVNLFTNAASAIFSQGGAAAKQLAVQGQKAATQIAAAAAPPPTHPPATFNTNTGPFPTATAIAPTQQPPVEYAQAEAHLQPVLPPPSILSTPLSQTSVRSIQTASFSPGLAAPMLGNRHGNVDAIPANGSLPAQIQYQQPSQLPMATPMQHLTPPHVPPVHSRSQATTASTSFTITPNQSRSEATTAVGGYPPLRPANRPTPPSSPKVHLAAAAATTPVGTLFHVPVPSRRPPILLPRQPNKADLSRTASSAAKKWGGFKLPSSGAKSKKPPPSTPTRDFTSSSTSQSSTSLSQRQLSTSQSGDESTNGRNIDNYSATPLSMNRSSAHVAKSDQLRESINTNDVPVMNPAISHVSGPSLDENINVYTQRLEPESAIPPEPKLSESWMEQRDPSSGRTYFINEMTNETRWERPVVVQPTAGSSSAFVASDMRPGLTDSAVVSSKQDAQSISPSSHQSTVDVNMKHTGGEISPDALPHGWTKEVDPSSGQVYYSNSRTSQSSWEMPVLSHGSNGDKASLSAAVSDPAEQPESSIPAQSSRQEEWTEEIDPNTDGEYFNRSTSETSWDRPVELEPEVTEKAQISVLSNSGASPEPMPLPHRIKPISQIPDTGTSLKEIEVETHIHVDGWVEQIDSSSGKDKAHYFNEITNETTSEKPICESVPPKFELKPSNQPEAVVAEEKEISEQPAFLVAAATDEPLATGWMEKVDPKTGRSYFFNSEAKETSWHRPAYAVKIEKSNDQPPKHFESLPALDPTKQRVDGNIVTSSNEWLEKVDTTSGRTYFYNISTTGTSWEKPVDLVEVKDQPAVVANKPQVENVDMLVSRPESTTPSIAREIDPLESSTSPGDAPAIGEAEETGCLIEVEAESIRLQAESREKADLGDWVQHTDPTSDNPYYVNAITGETTWEKPARTANSSHDHIIHTREEAHDQASQNEPESSIPDGQNDGMPLDTGGWLEQVHPETGQKYRYNEATNEIRGGLTTESDESPPGMDEATSMERNNTDPEETDYHKSVSRNVLEAQSDPTRSVEPEVVVAEEDSCVSPAQPELPPGWSAEFDDSAARFYYFNSETGESSWSIPEMEECYDQVVSNTEVQPNDKIAGDGEPESTCSGQQRLPETEFASCAWREVVDSTTGKTYYLNSITSETSWVNPTLVIDRDIEDTEDDGPHDVTWEDTMMTSMVADDGRLETVEPESSTHMESRQQIPCEEDVHQLETDEIPVVVAAPVIRRGSAGRSPNVLTESASEHLEVTTSNFTKSPQDEKRDHLAIESKEQDILETRMLEPDVLEDSSIHLLAVDSHVTSSLEPKDPLPVGWEEITDPTTGRSYFYNAEENTTTWDRPMLIPGDADNDNNEEINSSRHESADLLELSGVSRSGVTQENATGNDESSKDADDGVLVVQDAANENDEVSLAAGWQELIDASTRSTYYFHKESGKSSWERPLHKSIIKSTDDVAKSEGPAPIHEDIARNDEGVSEQMPDDDTVEHAVVTARAAEPQNNIGLPDGWVVIVDPTSEREYYFNRNANLTSWELPSEVAEPLCANTENSDDVAFTVLEGEEAKGSSVLEGEEGADQGSNPHLCDREDRNVDGNQTTERENTLLDGWVEITDPASGEPYYFNESENLTSWERPAAPSDSDLTEEASDRKIAPPQIEHGCSFRGQTTPKPVEDMTERDSGDLQLLRDNFKPHLVGENARDKFTGDLPEVGAGIANNPLGTPSEESNVSKGDKLTGAHVIALRKGDDSVAPTNLKLPPGWVELKDSTSEKTYYYNEAEGLTTWDHPKPPSNDSRYLKSTKEEERASPRAFACFGFGGRLCVYKGRQKTVELHKPRDLVPNHPLVQLEESKRQSGFTGPLHCGGDIFVETYISTAARNAGGDILWSLINIAAKSEGKLRSYEGVADTDSPESAIVQFLLQSDDTPSLTREKMHNGHNQGGGDQESLARVESLLLHGKREEAVSESLAGGHYAMALLIASQCDVTTFHETTRQFAECTFPSGSPLHTLTLILSEQLEPPTDEQLESNISPAWCSSLGDLRNWRDQVCAIISNRPEGWARLVFSLGDRLLELGEVMSAHCCYLISGCAVTSLLHATSRLTLVGCDHLVSMDSALITEIGLAAFARTEALEWAKRRGNPNAMVSSLQAFKARYAMMLADFGYTKEAHLYAASIREWTRAQAESVGDKCDTARAPATVWELSETGAIARFVDEFEERLVSSLDPSQKPKTQTVRQTKPLLNDASMPAPELAPSVSAPPTITPADPDMTFLSAVSTLTESHAIQSPASRYEASKPRGWAASKNRSGGKNGKTSRMSGSRPRDHTAQIAPTQSAVGQPDVSQPSQPNSSFAPAPSTTPKVTRAIFPPTATPTAISTPSPGVAGTNDSLLPSDPPTMRSDAMAPQTPMGLGKKHAREDSTVPPLPMKDGKEARSDVKAVRKPEKAPNSAPAELQRSKNKLGTPSSAQKSGWGLSALTEKITKIMNPNAVTADLGESMDAYYDDKTKRWIFPGEDPDEVAKPIGPPPSTVTPTKEEKEKEKPLDPLAALMAPPNSRRGVATPRARGPPVGRGGASFPPGMLPPGGSTPLAPSGPPPQFMMFTPKGGNEKKSSEQNASDVT